jgi:hypothetical protein
LTSRELEIVRMLACVQVATTGQIGRVVFGGAPPTSAALARRHLARLARSGLVRRFVDRSRDRKVGAPGYVHALTAAGLRLAGAEHGSGVRQRTAYRPSERYLAHRLAISELYVRLHEQQHAGGAAVRDFAAEPACWRRYKGPAGEVRTVKPDALVRLGAGGVELSWFVESDLATERPGAVADKCDAYLAYEFSGEEQRQVGVFPRVIFIVPSDARAAAIVQVVRGQPADAQGLFVVAVEEAALAVMTEVTG